MSTSSSIHPARRRSLLIRTGVFSAFIAGAVACGSSEDTPAPSDGPTASDDASTDDANTLPSKDAEADANDAQTPPTDDGDAGAAVDASPPPAPGTKHTALDISNRCALLDDHSVKCWGANESGQLGLGDQTTRGNKPNQMGDVLPAVDLGKGRSALAIAAGSTHTCVVLDNHSVKCWGTNNHGELGLGDKTIRGPYSNQMGDVLPAVDLGKGRSALAITAGSGFTCALLDNHSVKCWGDNNLGELGLGDRTDRGDKPNQMGDDLPAVDLGKGRSALIIAMGSIHTCALLDNHSVKCWGGNSYGQLGLGDEKNRGGWPTDMGDNLPTVDLGTWK